MTKMAEQLKSWRDFESLCVGMCMCTYALNLKMSTKRFIVWLNKLNIISSFALLTLLRGVFEFLFLNAKLNTLASIIVLKKSLSLYEYTQA